MRILHFADLHLGVESYGRPDPATGLSTRLLDFLRVFDEIVDYAINNDVDLVLFCGDAYKGREPTPTQQREFARRINRLASGGIAVFLLIGNHDLPNAVGKATATEIFDTLAIKNVYVSGRPEVLRIETRHGPVQVASLPWPRRSALLSKEDARGLDLDQVKQKIEEGLTRIVNNHAAKIDPALPAVLAAHIWVTGCYTGSEKMITIGQDHALTPGNLANPAFDYVALGHIHKQQVMHQSPPIVYAGSPERLDFSEENDDKGFYIVDIMMDNGRKQVDYHFHPVGARRFVSLEVDIRPDDLDPTATIIKELDRCKERIPDAVVRVSVTMPAAARELLRETDLKEALASAYHASVAREIKDTVRTRLGTLTGAELSPLEALQVWLDTRKTSAEKTRLLMDYGRRLVSGDS
jgi:DNA repair protein SbcD/Mre11